MWITYYDAINTFDDYLYEAFGLHDNPWFASSAWMVPGTCDHLFD